MGVDFSLQPALIERLDFERAALEETRRGPDLVPSWTAEAAGADHHQELAELVRAQSQAGFQLQAQEIVWASKGRYRYRPVGALPLRERIVYRTLVNDLVDELGEIDRSHEKYQAFERDVLSDTSARYVIIADVASFYYYVDHGHLQQRLVDVDRKSVV